MSTKKVLITGGAGFIGTHLAQKLSASGYSIRILDNLSPQIHGPDAGLPGCLKDKVEFVKGDIRNRGTVTRALVGIDAIIHLAAETGVGQSMYEIAGYVDTNLGGSAVLLEGISQTENEVKKIVLASSRAVYGEGKYRCENCGIMYPLSRNDDELKKQQWQMRCTTCGRVIDPIPTDEEALLSPTSVYAVTKQSQEQLFSVAAKAYHIPTTILRYFNVYGQGQSLNNPYTGILSIFSSRIVNGKPPLVYEDGLESRDFVHVSDVVNATVLALEKTEADYEVFNVGSGRRTTILHVADLLVDNLGSSLKPVIVGKYREGDIRHCCADLTKTRSKLGCKPTMSLEKGISEFVQWVKEQKCILDLSDNASDELSFRNLLKDI